ncbi:unnamed protein product, partial [Urochloa humidicola]
WRGHPPPRRRRAAEAAIGMAVPLRWLPGRRHRRVRSKQQQSPAGPTHNANIIHAAAFISISGVSVSGGGSAAAAIG